MKTEFNKIIDDWKRAKNHCRTTDNKEFTDKEPTEEFKRKLLIAEHSPLHILQYDWTWKQIPSWVATHWVRHVWDPFVSTQRDDRLHDDIPRGKKPQDAPVNFDGYANQQHLIDTWRKRLCFQASPETRELAEDFKITLAKTHPDEAAVLVPNCVYRCGCPEFKTCGYFQQYWKWIIANHPDADVFDIQTRYDLYNELFAEEHEVE